jgi:hypothetical protein
MQTPPSVPTTEGISSSSVTSPELPTFPQVSPLAKHSPEARQTCTATPITDGPHGPDWQTSEVPASATQQICPGRQLAALVHRSSVSEGGGGGAGQEFWHVAGPRPMAQQSCPGQSAALVQAGAEEQLEGLTQASAGTGGASGAPLLALVMLPLVPQPAVAAPIASAATTASGRQWGSAIVFHGVYCACPVRCAPRIQGARLGLHAGG